MRKQLFAPVAIIGYGCVFPPDGVTEEKFWNNVLSGKTGIADVSRTFWKEDLYYSEDPAAEDKTYCKKGGVIRNYSFPDLLAEEYGIRKEDTDTLTRTQKMTLDTILQAVRSAGFRGLDAIREADFMIGNMLGDSNMANYVLANRVPEIEEYLEEIPDFLELPEETREAAKRDLETGITENFGTAKKEENLIPSALLFRLRELLNIRGGGCIVDGACSGSGLVIHEAAKRIHLGKNKVCVTSAVLGNMVVTGNIGFAKIGGLSRTDSYPMDHRADGLIPGEGAGTVILKDLKEAIHDGNRIYAVIRGTGVASDGKGQSIYAPSSRGQLKAMNRSIEAAGMSPDEIDYIETHATGTRVGDKVEIETIRQFFAAGKDPARKIPIGSIKSQIGHAFSAAGMANLEKILLAFQHGVLPPTNHFEHVPDGVDLGPLYVNTEVRPWERRAEDVPRRAMLNAFGFGGINANVFLEEYLPAYHEKLIRQWQDREDPECDLSVVGIGVLGKPEGFTSGEGQETTILRKPDRWPEETENLFDPREGYLVQNYSFPFMKYHIPPKILKEIDLAQQYSLIAAGRAIDSYGREKIDGERTGVYVGAMMGLESAIRADFRVRHVEYLDLLGKSMRIKNVQEEKIRAILKAITGKVRENLPKVEEDTLPGYMDNIMAGRISNFFDFSGTNAVFDQDLVSFDAALYHAALSLENREIDTAVVGGVNGNMAPEGFDLGGILKMKEQIPAEGAVFFLIKRTADLKEEDRVYARICGLQPEESVSLPESQAPSGTPFYFGARDAFDLLERIFSRDFDPESEVIVPVRNGSLKQNGYRFLLCGRKAVIQKAEEKDIVPGEPKLYYFAGDEKTELFRHPVTCEQFEKTSLPFRAIIAADCEEELEKKTEFAEKYLEEKEA
ncbi:MAG: beta-ketoacyl synthase N-terminal-like domain-containing protein [Bilifractor sp.]|jgi:acyl transferase domain-containing protein